MRHNEHEVDHLEAFARRHGFELLTLRSISVFDVADVEKVQGALVPDREALQPYEYREGRRQKRPGFVCTMPFWFPSVQADGGVVPCEQDHGGTQRFGTMDESTSFRSIWFGPRATAARRRVRDHPETLSFCRNCPYEDRPTTDCSLESRPLVPEAVSRGFVIGRP
jgi:radical SAM protein with 4Fe4S-binding SPASM domain